jgi:hypothetical protein
VSKQICSKCLDVFEDSDFLLDWIQGRRCKKCEAIMNDLRNTPTEGAGE